MAAPATHIQPLVNQILTGAVADRNDGDDPYIGNRVRRTIIISWLLIVFFALGLPLFAKECKKLLATPEVDEVSSIFIICASCFIIICATSLILFFIQRKIRQLWFNNFHITDKYAKFASYGLIISGVIYFIGCLILSGTTKSNIMSWGSESFIPSGLSVLLGVDVIWKTLNNEIQRVKILSAFLAFSAASLLVVYIVSPINNTWIYVGYLVISVSTFAVLYVTTLCQDSTCCDCCVKNRKCKGLSTSYSRLLVTLILFVGSVSTVCGYFLHMNRFTNIGKEFYGIELTIYYVGYVILFWGSCNICALDIAIDDINE